MRLRIRVVSISSRGVRCKGWSAGDYEVSNKVDTYWLTASMCLPSDFMSNAVVAVSKPERDVVRRPEARSGRISREAKLLVGGGLPRPLALSSRPSLEPGAEEGCPAGASVEPKK